ncbi:MAG: hypothetical protein IT365_23465 [Candidatus Hydrogenedentes bacterium]|nr:hypothetical protein [Candidatus Hydrogenedentota bacterium]
MDTGEQTSVSGSYEKFVSTQVTLITGSTIMQRVLNDPAVSAIPQVAQAADRLTFLQEHVRARQKSGTELVQLECFLPDRDAALTILDAVKDEYLDYALGQEAYAGGERLRILVTERDSRQKDLELLLNQVNALQAKLGPRAADGPNEIGMYRAKLVKAEEDLYALGLRRSKLEAQLARLKGAPNDSESAGEDASDETFTDPEVATDPRVASLLGAHALAKLEYAKTLAKYPDGNPQLQQFEVDIRVIEAQIEETKRTVRHEVSQSKMLALADLEVENREATARVDMYRTRLTGYMQNVDEQRGDLTKLQSLEDSVAERRTLISELSRQITDLSLESKAPAQVSLASAPSVQAEPSYRAKLAALILACVASVGLGLVVSMAAKRRNPRRHSSPKEAHESVRTGSYSISS